MKVTDIFTLYHRENPPPPAGKDSGIRPVPEVERISLQPGQLFRGEVLGDDGKGHILLKIGDEIITTGGLLSMDAGQKVWVEVKEVGDSPLFALAEAKGAIHELLKNIMEIRPVVLAQEKGVTVVPPAFQDPPPPSALSFVPKLAPLQADGGLPRETLQLFKALLALPKTDIPLLPEAKMQQLAPFLSEESGRVDLRQVVSGLSRAGRIDPILRELAPLRPLFVFSPSIKSQVDSALPQEPGIPFPQGKEGIMPGTVNAEIQGGQQGSAATPVPFITAEGQVVAHVVQVVRGLVDAVPRLPQFVDRQEQTSMEQLTKGFTDLLKSILTAGKIPEHLRNLEPVRQLFATSASQFTGSSTNVQAMTAAELVEGFATTAISGTPLSPLDHNETVAKVLSSMQGAEPKPELLRVLKQLLSASQLLAPAEDEDGSASKDHHSAKVNETLAGLAKASSFFRAQALVSHEVAQVTQGDFVLVPSFFAGQSGWGEWLWSHEKGGEEGQKDSHEKLAFFLEMSNIGPVAIQAILAEKTLSAQFRVADDTAYRAIVLALPQLEERLKTLGYKANLTCQQKPVAVMQEIKDTLESRTNEASPSSLVDVQA